MLLFQLMAFAHARQLKCGGTCLNGMHSKKLDGWTTVLHSADNQKFTHLKHFKKTHVC